uniref:helix-turn-helix domain-containing protein n=1 Tax=Escherichia coli TaxID=562 RepID=UPI00202CAEB9
GLTALTAEFTVGEGKLMTHDEPCSMAPDDKHDLISGTCSHLPWQNRILELRDVQLIGHNSYEQIRATLLSMIDWNEELRSRIGVMNYIHQRTRISRSVVAEVLAALRKGGYIEMNKGKLVAINRLPSEY